MNCIYIFYSYSGYNLLPTHSWYFMAQNTAVICLKLENPEKKEVCEIFMFFTSWLKLLCIVAVFSNSFSPYIFHYIVLCYYINAEYKLGVAGAFLNPNVVITN